MSASAVPSRLLFLLHGEDSFRTRLRLAELVRDLLVGGEGAPGDLSKVDNPGLGDAIGVTRHDAKADGLDAIAMSGQSQGLFAMADDRTVVVVENAEALAQQDPEKLFRAFPSEAALVLLTLEKLETRRSSARPRSAAAAKKAAASPVSARALPDAVVDAGGRVERVERLFGEGVLAWIRARAHLRGVELAPGAVIALQALGSDSDRIEQELSKLAAFSGGKRVEEADVRQLVSGAIETQVFDLTKAVVQRDARTAITKLDALLAEGQAVQQILALLLWQFRVLLFAWLLERPDPGGKRPSSEVMAKAIRSSAGAIERWRVDARRINHAEITRAYSSLYATDVAIKSGRVDEDGALLTLCVLDLCGVRGAAVEELLETIPAPRR